MRRRGFIASLSAIFLSFGRTVKANHTLNSKPTIDIRQRIELYQASLSKGNLEQSTDPDGTDLPTYRVMFGGKPATLASKFPYPKPMAQPFGCMLSSLAIGMVWGTRDDVITFQTTDVTTLPGGLVRFRSPFDTEVYEIDVMVPVVIRENPKPVGGLAGAINNVPNVAADLRG